MIRRSDPPVLTPNAIAFLSSNDKTGMRIDDNDWDVLIDRLEYELERETQYLRELKRLNHGNPEAKHYY